MAVASPPHCEAWNLNDFSQPPGSTEVGQLSQNQDLSYLISKFVHTDKVCLLLNYENEKEQEAVFPFLEGKPMLFVQ